MAFTITSQPSNKSFNSCEIEIPFQISNTNTGVLYVVGYCQYYTTAGSWATIGGGFRLAQDINTSNIFHFDVKSIYQNIEEVDFLLSLGTYVPKFTNDRVSESWKKPPYGLVKCRVKFKQEVLNADGFIEESTGVELTSNEFYLFEMGARNKELIYFWNNAGATQYHVSQITNNPDERRPLTYAPQPVPSSHSANNWISWVKNPVSTAGSPWAGSTQSEYWIIMYTYVQGTLVGMHWHQIDGADYDYEFHAVGLQDWEQGILNGDGDVFPQTAGVPYFFPNEDLTGAGNDMSAVDSYLIQYVGGGSFLGVLTAQPIWTQSYIVIDAPTTFSVQSDCGLNTDEDNVPELVFHFRNIAGGFDRYQMRGGKYVIKVNTTAETYEPYRQYDLFLGNVAKGGKTKLSTRMWDEYSCTTQKHNPTEARWLREMMGSQEVYMEVQVGGEMWVEDLPIIYWQQIYINPESVEIINTDEDLLEISFNFIMSKEDITTKR